MKWNDAASSKDFGIAAAVALSCALAFSLALAALSTPKDFTEGLSSIAGQADQAAKLLQRGQRDERLAKGQVCSRPVEEEAQVLQTSLAGQASQLRLSLSNVDVRAGERTDPRSRLTPVLIRFEVSGAYGDAVAMLDGLGAAQPEVFVDTVDLASNTSSVTLAFSGRVFCSE